MDYNALCQQYISSDKPYIDIVNEMINKFNTMPLPIEEINRQIGRFAAQSNDAIYVNYSGYDLGLLRGSIIKPVKAITDPAVSAKRGTRSIAARSYLANRVATYSVGLVGGDIVPRDVANLLAFPSGEDNRLEDLKKLQAPDPKAKKEWLMNIVNDIEEKFNKIKITDDLSDEDVINNISSLDASCQAAVLRSVRDTFVNQYGVTFTEEEESKIQKLYNEGQSTNWTFLNRIGMIASPYYADVESLDMNRLYIMAESESELLTFKDNDVIQQAMNANNNYYSAKFNMAITNQADTFAKRHGMQKTDVLYQITNKDGSVVVTNYELTLGAHHAKAITLITPDRKYSADVDMNFDDSLTFNHPNISADFPAGGLMGKDFAKECADLFTEMDSVDHWYQRSSDEFKNTKKLLNAIASGKPMSHDTARANAEKLAEYADKYITNHCNKVFNEREKARMDIMTKISRTFHAKTTALDAIMHHAEEEHKKNEYVTDSSRAGFDKQADMENNLERVPNSTISVVHATEDRAFSDAEIDEIAQKFEPIKAANEAYFNKPIKNDIGNDFIRTYISNGNAAAEDLLSYAAYNIDALPDEFDPVEAVTATVISSIIKMEREANNPGYLTNAADGADISIKAGPFEKLASSTYERGDLVNALKKTETIRNFCKDLTSEKIADMLLTHKEVKLANLVQTELTASELTKSVSLETNLRRTKAPIQKDALNML